jgi:D-lactate dehydrogenase
VVTVAESVEQIAKTLQYAIQNHRSVTFRASGSSPNGQSQGDDILIIINVRNCFNGIEILEDELYARINPGTIVSDYCRIGREAFLSVDEHVLRICGGSRLAA